MDWELEALSEMTIEVDFMKGGKKIFSATTWAGFLGILTANRIGGYSVSVNFRSTSEGSLWKNFKRAIKNSWPVGFLVREILETTSTYQAAVEHLAKSDLARFFHVQIFYYIF